jgi:hypothetical protein
MLLPLPCNYHLVTQMPTNPASTRIRIVVRVAVYCFGSSADVGIALRRKLLMLGIFSQP